MTQSDGSGAVYHWAVCGQELPPSMQCAKPNATAAASASTTLGQTNELVAATRVAGGQCSTIGTWRDARGDTYDGPRWIHEYRVALDELAVFDLVG